jgi:hypothetical protein
MYMHPILNGFWDRAISLHSSSDLAPKIILPSRVWIGVRRQLAVVTIDSDIVGVLWKMWQHIFTNAKYSDTLYAILTWVAKCIDGDSGIFKNVLRKLYQLCHLTNKYQY